MPTQFIKKVTELAWIRNLRSDAGYGASGIGTYEHALYFNSDGTPRRVWAPSDAARIYVDATTGDDANSGSRESPLKTLTAAIALISATRKAVFLGPGAFVEAAAVVWPSLSGVSVVGAGYNLTSISCPVSGVDRVITVTPGVQTGTWSGYLEGVEINHNGLHPTHAQSGIRFDNTGMTKKLYFAIKNCTSNPDAVTDKFINVATHEAGNAIRIYISGDGSQAEIGGAMYFAVNDNADRLHLENLWLIGSCTMVGADQLRVRCFRCVIPEHSVRVAFIGNSGLQVVTLVNSFQWTDYNDTVPEIFEKAESANVTTATAVVVAN